MTESHDKRTETHACDLISRQAAIDAVKRVIRDNRSISVCDAIKALPSAQPAPDLHSACTEIIYCKDCRYYKELTPLKGECWNNDMWWSIKGDTAEVDAIEVYCEHYCGYADKGSYYE